MITFTTQHRKMKLISFALTYLAISILPIKAKPLKVFILAGQSNMQGSAHINTFAAIGDDPKTAHLLKEVWDRNKKPITCKNAWITYKTQQNGTDTILNSKVKVGFGFDSNRIGPEYSFAITMDKALKEPILIIKTAWGGKSLAVDFRPPSAGPYKATNQANSPTASETGHYYRQMIKFIKETLKDTKSIKKVAPKYRASSGFEISGFVWFQGWNDMCNHNYTQEYSQNLIHLVNDVRKDLNKPNLPFIVGIMGVYGTEPEKRKFDKGLRTTVFRNAQFAAVKHFKNKTTNNVIAVDSGPFYEHKISDIYWKRRLTSHWKQQVKQGAMSQQQLNKELAKHNFGNADLTKQEQQLWDRGASNAEYHYLGSGKTFIRIGKAFAEAILKSAK